MHQLLQAPLKCLISVDEYDGVKLHTWHLYDHKPRKYAMTSIEGLGMIDHLHQNLSIFALHALL